MASEYTPPAARLGDTVYWYNDPQNLANPQLGWVCERPGARTMTLLVFAPGVGFIEKASVRYKDDPGLLENPAWRSWGCWDFSDAQKELGRIQDVATKVMASHERKAVANVK